MDIEEKQTWKEENPKRSRRELTEEQNLEKEGKVENYRKVDKGKITMVFLAEKISLLLEF